MDRVKSRIPELDMGGFDSHTGYLEVRTYKETACNLSFLPRFQQDAMKFIFLKYWVIIVWRQLTIDFKHEETNLTATLLSNDASLQVLYTAWAWVSDLEALSNHWQPVSLPVLQYNRHT